MIHKQDILDRAAEWGLRPDVVEKDYVLGWLLAAFGAHGVASRSWVFKGGTCLKKCYFETYRFSEDLDFSLTPEAPYEEGALRELVAEVAASVTEMSGINCPADRIEIRPRKDKLGRPTFQGKVAYQGPLAVPNWPRILLDITQHEIVVQPPVGRSISHPYPDGLPDGAKVICYSLEELFAEKTRALLERTRPRDLYDVMHIWDRRDELSLDSARTILIEKCKAKNIEPPTTAIIIAMVRASAELRADWSNMLAHQLPNLPTLDGLLDRLDESLGWIDAPIVIAQLPAYRVASGETRVAPRGGAYWGGGQRLEVVRFAGANRLKIAFTYDGTRRVAEPYSLRRKNTGNLVLYAWESGATHIKSFDTAKIRNIEATDQLFVPKFRVELTG